jgi:hypothetical protein
MQTVCEPRLESFVDRRSTDVGERPAGPERRQFRSTGNNWSPEVAELAQAVDQYKLRHRRRFITFEELYNVISDLGYAKCED